MTDKNTQFDFSQLGISDPEGEKNETIEIFKDNLVDFLRAETELVLEAISEYNVIIIALLDADPQFRKKLENALYENQQVLTGKKFMLEGKPKTPNVSNWLKDFIKTNGTDKFDNVVLTQFASNSPNARILDQAEKDLLRKLLVLYRNLKFFPDSLKDLPVEDWQIIPAKRPVEDSPSRARLAAGQLKKGGRDEKSENLKAAEAPVPPGLDVRSKAGPMPAKAENTIPSRAKSGPPAPPPIRVPETRPKMPQAKKDPAKEQKLMELYREARKYPEGSIQRRAVEEEIGKINEG